MPAIGVDNGRRPGPKTGHQGRTPRLSRPGARDIRVRPPAFTLYSPHGGHGRPHAVRLLRARTGRGFRGGRRRPSRGMCGTRPGVMMENRDKSENQGTGGPCGGKYGVTASKPREDRTW
ncbi:hypothetical protein Skr01_53300 [Sphaerisporangium krabiense]|nr:hypothetical protein Skr01_53300 [Sphaerisporangium krabiense]